MAGQRNGLSQIYVLADRPRSVPVGIRHSLEGGKLCSLPAYNGLELKDWCSYKGRSVECFVLGQK